MFIYSNYYNQCLCPIPHPQSFVSVETKDKVLRTITSTHTLVFSQGNVLEKKTPASEWTQWDNAVRSADEYARATKTVIKKEDLNIILPAINDANNTLVNTVKLLQNKYNGTIPAQDRQNVDAILAPLKPQINKMKTYETFLQQDLFRKKNDDVAQVLYTLVLTLETTLDKIIADAYRLMGITRPPQ